MIEVMYEYRIVQIPAKVLTEVSLHDSAGAKYLQELVNFGAEKGWEFLRIDTLGHLPIPGCQVITFRRSYVAPPVEIAHPHHETIFVEPIASEALEDPLPEKPWWR